jgi:hypothetical protein
MAALSTRELVRSEKSQNGKHADDVAVLSTQELAGSEEVEKVKEVGVVKAGESIAESIAENEQKEEDVAGLDTQGLANGKEVETVKTGEAGAEDVTGLDTQGLANGKEVEAIITGRVEAENEQPAEDVAGLDTQGLEHAEEKAQVEGSAPGANEAAEGVYIPAEFSEVDKVQTQGEPLQTGTDEEGDRAQVQAASPFVSPTPPLSPPPLPTPAPKVRRGSAVRWMMIAVVCVLVLAGIAGGLLFLLRSQGTATTVTPGVGASPTVRNTVGSTPSGTTCPKKSLAVSCITPVTGTTPVVGTKAVFNITLSGALQGPMTVTSMARCGPSTSGTEYDLYFSGTIGGTIYNFVGRIPSYKGPADYNTGQISVVFAQQPLATTSVWGNSGNVPAKATINADMKSGTMDITLSGASNTLHVSGNWVCAV